MNGRRRLADTGPAAGPFDDWCCGVIDAPKITRCSAETGRFAMMEVVTRWQALVDKLISASVEVLNKAVIPPENLVWSDPKVISLLLLARTLSHSKGVRALLKAGRVLEARILTRNCLENGFWLGGLVDEGASFVAQMVEDEQKRRASRGQLLFENRVQFDEAVEQRLRTWMRERKHWHDSKTLNPKGVADGTSLDGAYIFYSELSVDAHPGLEALTRYLARDDDAELDFEPRINLEEVIDTLYLHSYSVLTVLVQVNQMVGHGAGELMIKLTEEFQALEQEIPKAILQQQAT